MLFGRKDRKPIKIVEKPVKEWKYTTCGYCSTGCSIEVGIDEDGKAVGTRGDTGADVNRGKLCIKGIFEHQLFDSEGRGGQPLMRDKFYQDFKPASWDQALDKTAAEFKRIQEKYGKDSVAVV
ncbi:molybdopterin-dependent oxidoreductase, partial [Oleiphilus sp. HI0117]